MINIGVIGCGKISLVRHIPEYSTNPNVELVAYYDLNNERSEAFSDHYGGKSYSSWQSMLEDSSIDAVSVCTPNWTHAEITIAALESGKHVLCEKPMAMNLAECESMVAAAERSGKFLMIGQNQRLAKAHVRARELIERGLIGDIITFDTKFGHNGPEKWSVDPGSNTWFFDKEMAGIGAMADLGIHKTDLIHYLTGQTIVEVTAKLDTLNKKSSDGKFIELDDNAFCIYKLSGGALGTMHASWTFNGQEDNSTIIYGTTGIMKIYTDSDYTIEIHRSDGEKEYYVTDRIQTNDDQTKSGIIDLFIKSIVNNEPPSISGQEVLKSMRAVFGAIESSERGCTVFLDQK